MGKHNIKAKINQEIIIIIIIMIKVKLFPNLIKHKAMKT
jgi:hypothetical protein